MHEPTIRLSRAVNQYLSTCERVKPGVSRLRTFHGERFVSEDLYHALLLLAAWSAVWMEQHQPPEGEPTMNALAYKLPAVCAARNNVTGDPIYVKRGVAGYFPADSDIHANAKPCA